MTSSNAPSPPTDGDAEPQLAEAPRGEGGFHIGRQAFQAAKPQSALYIVSTPIGNLGDITVRALETLAACDLIACEDTRVTATLMQRFGLRTALTAYHEHNAARVRPRLLATLENGGSVALVSDAGTPLISDPGYRLVRDVVEAGHRVVPIPGASAPLAALVGAGLPSDTICFSGFLPHKGGQRRTRLGELARLPATLVIFESPRRLASSLADMADVLGADREAVVARELTKRFETFERGTLAELAERYADATVKGEIVVCIAPPGVMTEADPEDADALLTEALNDMKAAAAAKHVAQMTGVDRKTLYKRAMELKAQ
ncbi:16S rRNA (cytidine(1402)-2'-O)-methyltransferase [Stappia sp. ES.058]|uniref:16S rRNA (cytidine(1402)-2'-O)-methyltransferase n=1 Tax=Stappia sp. ES.058 TaxID=1881061 RepID=UPI00087BA55E|nr:16S rRNA (cytidine(1402)-2'-O)-methyltransferase [Stappia sp. ES.058]SDU44463.1 16S rRNA (cytidine1402-2'-O)-methyltransferase [Stappia sp. ES.058]